MNEGRFSPDFVCTVISVTYDFKTRIGRLDMNDQNKGVRAFRTNGSPSTLTLPFAPYPKAWLLVKRVA